MNHAVQLLAEKVTSRGGRGVAAKPLKELGEHPDLAGPINIMKGKYGPYVKWEKINATIPSEIEPEDLSIDHAHVLINEKISKSSTKRKTVKKKTAKKPVKKKQAKWKKVYSL